MYLNDTQRQILGVPLPDPGLSTHIRTTCCHAPVRQGYELTTLILPVQCARCGREAGAPGVEDIQGLNGSTPQVRPDFSG